MRKSIGIAVVAIVAVAMLWGWTLSNSGAKTHKTTAAATSGIDVLDLTMKAGTMPVQQFDAH